MKTDRELLELSAKAAGIYVANDENGNATDLFCDAPGSSAYEWNPLTDDGDALRLAVRLQIVAGKYDNYASAGVIGSCVEFVVWDHEEANPYAATRRAITRAAAAIGEGMK